MTEYDNAVYMFGVVNDAFIYMADDNSLIKRVTAFRAS